MNEKKLMIITCISSIVAGLAVLALVLCLVGVIPVVGGNSSGSLSEADHWREQAQNAPANAGLTTPDLFDYLDGIGDFSCDKTASQFTTPYHYRSDDGFFVCVIVSEIIDTSYSYSQRIDGSYDYAHADILDPSQNTGPEEMEAYADFLDWCDEKGVTREQIIEVLDYYVLIADTAG